MRALSVHLPDWPINLAIRERNRRARRDSREGHLLLLTERVGGKERVAACCGRCRRLHVRVGMTVAHARSLLRGVEVEMAPHTPGRDTERLTRLARWALRFSPLVAPDGGDGLLMDVTGCGHLFGGDAGLARRLAGALEGLGFLVRVAVAPTYGCARAVARYGGQRVAVIEPEAVGEVLGVLPPAALGLSETVCEALGEVGIDRIGELLRQPRRALKVRFGAEVLDRLDGVLRGGREVPRWVQPAQSVERSVVFDGPIANEGIVRRSVHRLLDELVEEMRRRRRGVCALRVRLTGADAAAVAGEVLLNLSSPSGSTEHLWRLLEPKLETLRLREGVSEVRLTVERAAAVRWEQFGLWRDAWERASGQDARATGELIDQLVDRLGDRRVGRVEPVERYFPEQAFRRRAVCLDGGRRPDDRGIDGDRRAVRRGRGRERGGAEGEPAGARVRHVPRPSRVFDRAEPASVMALVPDGPPVRVRWRGRDWAVRAGIGPERIAPPWWTERPGSSRDYFQVQDERGRWLWLFRESASGRWFVHGEWA